MLGVNFLLVGGIGMLRDNTSSNWGSRSLLATPRPTR